MKILKKSSFFYLRKGKNVILYIIGFKCIQVVIKMFKNLIPDYYFSDISSIDVNILRKKGIKHIICDLDNTLDSHETKTPSENALLFFEKLKGNGFSVCIISNGKESRVKTYTDGTGLKYIADAGKPLKKSYLKALSSLECEPKDAAFIGDQIFTDTWGANRLGIMTILVDPIESFENPFFYIKRALETFIKSKITKE